VLKIILNYTIEGENQATMYLGGKIALQPYVTASVATSGYFSMVEAHAWQHLHNFMPGQIARHLGLGDFEYLVGFNPNHRNVAHFFEALLTQFFSSSSFSGNNSDKDTISRLMQQVQNNLSLKKDAQATVACEFLLYVTTIFAQYFLPSIESYLGRGRNIFDVNMSLVMQNPGYDFSPFMALVTQLKQHINTEKDTDVKLARKKKLQQLLLTTGWEQIALGTTVYDITDLAMRLRMKSPYEFCKTLFSYYKKFKPKLKN